MLLQISSIFLRIPKEFHARIMTIDDSKRLTIPAMNACRTRFLFCSFLSMEKIAMLKMMVTTSTKDVIHIATTPTSPRLLAA